MLEEFLAQVDPNDKYKRQFAQKLMREWFDRAMGGSDYLLKEILERIEGKLASPAEKERDTDNGVKAILLDSPRPRHPNAPKLPLATERSQDPKNW
jgi:hypothetical protein